MKWVGFLSTLGVLCWILWKGVHLNPAEPTLAMINKAVPAFSLATLSLSKATMSEQIFKGKITLLNVWNSQCNSCLVDHAFWMTDLKNQYTVIGLNYHDTATEAKRWLDRYGNPYEAVLLDKNGTLGINLGLYGTPETYVIDKQGIIRHRHLGPLKRSVWETEFLPLLKKLESQP